MQECYVENGKIFASENSTNQNAGNYVFQISSFFVFFRLFSAQNQNKKFSAQIPPRIWAESGLTFLMGKGSVCRTGMERVKKRVSTVRERQ